MLRIFIITSVILMSQAFCFIKNDVGKKLDSPPERINKEFYLSCPCSDLGYFDYEKEKILDSLHMLAGEYKYGVKGINEEEKLKGMVLRCLRFQNITQKIEKKYELPENLLLAMVMNETGGVELLPNGKDDGGLGLCHLQPYTANKFGLKTLDNCTQLRAFEHGRKLRKLIDAKNRDYAQLIQLDDRFHIIKNLDAVARMLRFYMAREYADDPVEMAISYYGGLDKYPYYYNRIMYYHKKLSDLAYVNHVRQEFNKINPNFTINGEKAGFDDYIQYFHKRNLNFDLVKY